MCIMCMEIIKQKMSLTEAYRNLGEVINDRRETQEAINHYKELREAIDNLLFDELAGILDEGGGDDDSRTVR